MITFRPIEPNDQDFLFEVYASAREDELAVVPWSDEEKLQFLLMQFNAQHAYYQEQFTNADFQIVLQDDVQIGRLYIDRREDEIGLIDIALLPEYRGKGIGTQLLKNILDEAGESGKVVRIHVETFNPALRLYERLGFVKIEDQGVYYLMEWSPESHTESLG